MIAKIITIKEAANTVKIPFRCLVNSGISSVPNLCMCDSISSCISYTTDLDGSLRTFSA